MGNGDEEVGGPWCAVHRGLWTDSFVCGLPKTGTTNKESCAFAGGKHALKKEKDAPVEESGVRYIHPPRLCYCRVDQANV